MGYFSNLVTHGINDLLAMRAADLEVLSIQQIGKCPKLLCEGADVVRRDLKEIVGLLKRGFSGVDLRVTF